MTETCYRDLGTVRTAISTLTLRARIQVGQPDLTDHRLFFGKVCLIQGLASLWLARLTAGSERLDINLIRKTPTAVGRWISGHPDTLTITAGFNQIMARLEGTSD